MAICNSFLKEEDDKLVEAALNGEFSGIQSCSPEIREAWEKATPAAEAAKEARIIECLKENIENGRRDSLEMLAKSESADPQATRTNLQKLDSQVEPTNAEYKAMFDVAKEIGKVENLEIVDTPVVTGINGDQSVSVVDKELQKMGYNKPIDKIPHLDIETVRALAKETLSFLYNSKIPEDWRDQATVNMIVGIDKQEPGSEKGKVAVEKAVAPDLLKADLYRSRNLYLFQNAAGRLVPRDTKDAKNEKEKKEFEKERIEFRWKIAHGICHINDVSDGRIDSLVISPDGAAAFMAQLKAGPVSDYAEQAIRECQGDLDRVMENPEFRAELFAAWVMDSPKLCIEARKLFDQNFSR
ncbi:hypothetical protein KKE19_00490 [Patescibacteria group bacterium]|nr:hypothetical protein [Patescibacteria group bacterium]MBU4367616.1 hypothetical protein [Patescibacteria group bacterium]MBU4462096.1 hypothetical protein [Patescibacteria group bacterium]MCG2700415.1 hypothetical protein [Candidatus Parcubacteria bacterium]